MLLLLLLLLDNEITHALIHVLSALMHKIVILLYHSFERRDRVSMVEEEQDRSQEL
jgi:hypothetical protein